MNRTTLERGTFFIVVATVSLAFAWIIAPFFGSIFWALVLAIVLGPVYRAILKRFSKRPTTVSLATLLISAIVGGLLCFGLRFMAIRFGWHLPHARRSNVHNQATSGDVEMSGPAVALDSPTVAQQTGYRSRFVWSWPPTPSFADRSPHGPPQLVRPRVPAKGLIVVGM